MVGRDFSLSLSPFNPYVRRIWHQNEWYYAIVDIIVAKVKEIPQFDRLGRSIDLVLMICEHIENLVHGNDVKGEKGFKADIAVKIFERLGFLKAEDKEFLINCINCLHSCDRIKKNRIELSKMVETIKPKTKVLFLKSCMS